MKDEKVANFDVLELAIEAGNLTGELDVNVPGTRLVRISEDTHKKLVRLQIKAAVKLGKFVSLKDVLGTIINYMGTEDKYTKLSS